LFILAIIRYNRRIVPTEVTGGERVTSKESRAELIALRQLAYHAVQDDEPKVEQTLEPALLHLGKLRILLSVDTSPAQHLILGEAHLALAIIRLATHDRITRVQDSTGPAYQHLEQAGDRPGVRKLQRHTWHTQALSLLYKAQTMSKKSRPELVQACELFINAGESFDTETEARWAFLALSYAAQAADMLGWPRTALLAAQTSERIWARAGLEDDWRHTANRRLLREDPIYPLVCFTHLYDFADVLGTAPTQR
jgi:hypothetical protein